MPGLPLLGNSVTAISVGATSAFLNPAGLGQMIHPELDLEYGNQFGLSDLTSEAASLGYRFKTIGMAAGLSNFGKSDFYQEQRISLSAGKEILNNLSLGMTARYLLLKAAGYSDQDAIALDLGFLWQKDRLKTGGVVKNINQPNIGGDQILRNYNVGVIYSVLPQVALSAGIYYDTDFKEQVQLGQETSLSENFALRLGFQTEPNRYSLGAGFSWSKLGIDYAFVNHPDLGGSHVVGMKIKW